MTYCDECGREIQPRTGVTRRGSLTFHPACALSYEHGDAKTAIAARDAELATLRAQLADAEAVIEAVRKATQQCDLRCGKSEPACMFLNDVYRRVEEYDAKHVPK